MISDGNTPDIKLKESDVAKVSRNIENHKTVWAQKWEVLKQKPSALDVFGDKVVKVEVAEEEKTLQ